MATDPTGRGPSRFRGEEAYTRRHTRPAAKIGTRGCERLLVFSRVSVWLLALPAAAVCVAVAGCGPGYEVVPVSGQVTWQGEPLAGWGVQFRPIAEGPAAPSPGSHGTTDTEGRYTLHLVDPDRPGGVVGRHRIQITPPGAAEQDPLDDLGDPHAIQFPPHFLDGSIEFTVLRGGTAEADLHLHRVPDPQHRDSALSCRWRRSVPLQ